MTIRIVLNAAVLRNENKSIVNLQVVGGYTARCVRFLAVAALFQEPLRSGNLRVLFVGDQPAT